MTPKETIAAALDLLHELDADPRHPTMRALSALIESGPEIEDESELQLIAVIEQGGSYTVTDQHGRQLRGVQSVAVFKDPQTGADVMQVNL